MPGDTSSRCDADNCLGEAGGRKDAELIVCKGNSRQQRWMPTMQCNGR